MLFHDFPEDILKLLLLKLDTEILLYLCIHKPSYYQLCHQENFWVDKFVESYPDFVGYLLNDSYIETLLLLEGGKYIELNSRDNRIFIDGETTIGAIYGKYGGNKTMHIGAGGGWIGFTISDGTMLMWAHRQPLSQIDSDTPLWALTTPNNENLYIVINSIFQI